MNKATKQDFLKFLAELSRDYRIIGPVSDKDGKVDLEPVKDVQDITFDYVNTERSFKRFIYPQTQELFQFENNQITETETDFPPQVIVGVRNCDLNSFNVLDFNFLEKDPVDLPYQQARENTVLISSACTGNKSTCFCKSFKIEPLSMEGGDICYLFDYQTNSFYIQANSGKGKELLKKLNMKEADDFEEKIKDFKKNHEDIEDFIEGKDFVELFQDKLEDDRWEEIFKGCINCGICTFYCPTCYCFDIQEEGKFWAGRRVRNWDSCMFSIYTKETSGHNPRPTLREKYRNRVLHKFYYQLKHNDNFGCVGCGRCIDNCPTNIDIRRIVKSFI